VQSAPEKREAQRMLARDVTTSVHGAAHVERAEHASQLLFGEDITLLSADDVLAVFADVPSTELNAEQLSGEGVGIVDLVALSKLAPSKSEARRLVQSGGVYVNNRRMADVQARIRVESAIDGRVLVLRKGARQNHLVRIVRAGG
jgi:tyrosyl-tRNA synthetase